MPILLRRRLDCFYCGKKSIQRYEYGLTKWKCENCQAENYLDANGEITEPPAPVASSAERAQRYAQALPRSASPITNTPDASPFCQTCLNNQYLVTKNLANYLPDTADPRYREFEANLPKYKKELEARYPQLCANCEPKVRERMRAAGAMAKADYLGKMMDKTRQVGLPKDIWTPVFLSSLLGCLLWLSGTVLLIVWNGLGTLASPSRIEDGLLPDPEDINIFKCIGQAIGFTQVDCACPSIASDLAGWGIAATLASFWWNPVMRRRNIDRTIGLVEFYKLQIVLLAARFGSWYLLENKEGLKFDPSVVRLVHATMLAINLAIPVLAYRTARIAKNPRISFQDTYQPLQNAGITSSETTATISQYERPNVYTSTTYKSVTFPYSKINQSRNPEPPIPITPPSDDEESDADAMDIDTPQSKHNFRPTNTRPNQPLPQEPSPFYGKLPAAPVSQEHRLRNPPNRPSFQKTSTERQDKFFQSMTKRQPESPERQGDSPIEFKMQQPRMLIKDDHQETGLEGWFSSNVFSLGEPTMQKSRQGAHESQPAPPMVSQSGHYLYFLPLLSLVGAICLWVTAPRSMLGPLVSYYAASGLGAVVAGTRFATVISSELVNISDVLLCTVELFGAAALGYQVRQTVLSQLDVDVTLGLFPLLYFGFMILQECLVLVTSLHRYQSVTSYQSLRTQTPPRAKKLLPLENNAVLVEPLSSSRSPAEPYSARGVAFAGSSMTTQSPGSAGLASLSLSLGDEISQNTSSQRTKRALRGRAAKPWEVGGL